MFSGIVAAMGRIVQIENRDQGLRLRIETGGLDLSDVAVGDSIAVNGVCLTAVGVTPPFFEADVSAETLACTAGLDSCAEVNLEKALRLSDRLGGHLVSGHVDGVAEVKAFSPVGNDRRLVLQVPATLAKYIARKGSICVQGVSLTVNAIRGEEVEINLIPHTLSATTLRDLQTGSRVNIEVDQLARYVERLVGND